jgi:hypothetical protein
MQLVNLGGSSVLLIDVFTPQWREATIHMGEAQSNGYGTGILIKDPVNAEIRRGNHLKGTRPEPGKDRDEFPPAMVWDPLREPQTGEPGGASVKPINPSDNRSFGSCLKYKLSGVPNGSPVILGPSAF